MLEAKAGTTELTIWVNLPNLDAQIFGLASSASVADLFAAIRERFKFSSLDKLVVQIKDADKKPHSLDDHKLTLVEALCNSKCDSKGDYDVYVDHAAVVPSTAFFNSKSTFVENLGTPITTPTIDTELKADVISVQGLGLAKLAPTNTPLNLFLREGARKELEFLEKKSLPLIYGPPGTGKSVVAWLFAQQAAQRGSQVVWHHYTTTGFFSCLLTSNKIVPIQEQRDIEADILILDGIVRGAEPEIAAGLAWQSATRASGRKCKLCIITSQQLNVKHHEMINIGIETGEVLSWTKAEYEAAVNHAAIKEQVKAAVAPNDEETWEDQFEDKHFLAGGSCRLMFSHSSEAAKEAIDNAINACGDYRILVSGLRGNPSALATNSLIQLTAKGRFLISEYAARLLADRVDSEFVKLAMQICRNPAFDSWIMEMDFLIRTKQASGMTLYDISNEEPVFWEFLGFQKLFHDPSDITEIKPGWLVPDRWHQGGYDAVRITFLTKESKTKRKKPKIEAKEETLLMQFVQVTRAQDHSFKARYMNAMIAVLAALAAAKPRLAIEKKFCFLVPQGRGDSFQCPPTVDAAWKPHISVLEFQ